MSCRVLSCTGLACILVRGRRAVWGVGCLYRKSQVRSCTPAGAQEVEVRRVEQPLGANGACPPLQHVRAMHAGGFGHVPSERNDLDAAALFGCFHGESAAVMVCGGACPSFLADTLTSACKSCRAVGFGTCKFFGGSRLPPAYVRVRGGPLITHFCHEASTSRQWGLWEDGTRTITIRSFDRRLNAPTLTVYYI